MSARVVRASEEGALAEAERLLGQGEVVAIPTETVYGLAVVPQAAALRRLLEVKRRSTEKGIQLLIDSLEQVRAHVRLTHPAEALAERYWPGGLTLVLDMLPDAGWPELLSGGRATVGLRLPDHAVPRELSRRLGPIAASSANLSGLPPAISAEQVEASLAAELPLILDDGPVRGGVPSTVVACPGDGSQPVVLREGAVTREEIAATLRQAAG